MPHGRSGLPGIPHTPRCWRRRRSSRPLVEEQRGSELGLQRTETQPRGTSSPPGWRRRVQLLQKGKCVKPEAPTAHLGTMALITSLPGTQTRGMWILDLHHAAEHSGASSEGQVFWPWAQVDLTQGCHCPLLPGNTWSQQALAPTCFTPPFPQLGAFLPLLSFAHDL